MSEQPLYEPVWFDKPQPADEIIPPFCRVEGFPSTPTPVGSAPMVVPPAQPVAPMPPQLSFAPPPPPRIERVLNPMIVTGSSSGRVKPYDVAQDFLGKVAVRQCGEAFYLFNGRAYAPVTVEQLGRHIMATCRTAIQQDGSAKLITQVIDLLRREGDIEEAEVNRGFISFYNGLLCLVDGNLLPHTAGIFSTAQVEANCAPQLAGKHPLFSRFLAQVSGGDAVLEQRIWQMLGYALTPDTNAKSLFLLQGVPNSGKSLLGELLTRLLPDDAVTSLSLNDLGRNFGPSALVGKSLCLSMDLPATPWDSKAVGMLKALTGNDLVTADVKYQPRAKFRNSATFLFGTNHAGSP